MSEKEQQPKLVMTGTFQQKYDICWKDRNTKTILAINDAGLSIPGEEAPLTELELRSALKDVRNKRARHVLEATLRAVMMQHNLSRTGWML